MLATAVASAGDLDAAAELAQHAERAQRASGAAASGLAPDGAGLAAGAADTFRAAAEAKAAGNAAYRWGVCAKISIPDVDYCMLHAWTCSCTLHLQLQMYGKGTLEADFDFFLTAFGLMRMIHLPLRRSGDYSGARDAYLRCVQAEPRCSAAHCNLAAAHAQVGRHDLAVQAAQEALRLNRCYAKARQRLEESQRALQAGAS
jgi:tetratricopeptide (TPR) repeat protein